MTIKVYADRIEIGAKTITTTPTGIRIGDSLAANTQQQGYINQANFTARELAFGNFVFQGSVAGFTAGGYGPSFSNVIDKFPFTADTNATDVGDLTLARVSAASQSSTTHGYTAGGEGSPGNANNIDKFLFASNGNATDVGDLAALAGGPTGQSSTTNGYATGGVGSPGVFNTIRKFSFATDTNAVNVGSGTIARRLSAGQSSTTNGYTSGGFDGPPGSSHLNTIDKFPFAADTNATDVGDLTQARSQSAGQSSTTHGYNSGGNPGPLNTIDKFPFTADSNATDVGDLSVTRGNIGSGQSSTVSGYTSGGTVPPGSTTVNTIDKFPFSADSNATDVGDLSVSRFGPAGTQF